MSITGLATARGCEITIKREGARTKQSDGSYNQGWGSVATSVSVVIQEIDTGVAQKLWGQEAKASHACYAPGMVDLRTGDGVLVTAGHLSGLRFRVEKAPRPDMTPGSVHVAAGLVLTTETFS